MVNGIQFNSSIYHSKKMCGKDKLCSKKSFKKISDAIIKACNHILDNPDQYLNEFPVPFFKLEVVLKQI